MAPSSLRNSTWECEKQVQPSCLSFPHAQQSFSPFPALSLWIILKFLSVSLREGRGKDGFGREVGNSLPLGALPTPGMGKELLLPNSSLSTGKSSKGLTELPTQLLQAMLELIPFFPFLFFLNSIFLVFPPPETPTPHLPAALPGNQHRITPWPQAAQEFWERGKILARLPCCSLGTWDSTDPSGQDNLLLSLERLFSHPAAP